MKPGRFIAALLFVPVLLTLPGCISFESDVFVRQSDPKPSAERKSTLVTQTTPDYLDPSQSNFERTSSK